MFGFSTSVASFVRQRVIPSCVITIGSIILMTPRAHADDQSGFYAAAVGGLSTLSDRTYDYTPTGAASAVGVADLSGGYAFGFALGYDFSQAFRAEAEYIYRTNDLGTVSTPGLDTTTGGDLASVTVMANAYYDVASFEVGSATVEPYVGLGLGFAQETDTDLETAASALQFSGNSFAYQALAGVNWTYDSGVFAGLGVRYTDAGRMRLTGDAGELRVKYAPVAVTLSIGYRF